MSNDLVSQQLPIRSIQMSQQLEHISGKLNPSTQMGFGSGASLHDSSMQQVSVPIIQMGMVGSHPSDAASQQTSASIGVGTTVFSNNKQETAQIDPFSYNMASGNFLMPDKKPNAMGSMLQDMEPQQLATSNKRKAPMGAAVPQNPVPQRYIAPKRFTLNEHRPWLQPTMPITNKPPAQMQSPSYTPSSQPLQGPPRKTAPIKTGAQSTTSVQRSQPGPMKPPPKVKSDSFASVRSKLRESLAAALALVQDKAIGGGKDKSQAAGSSPEPPSSANGTNLSSEPRVSLSENTNAHNIKQDADLVQNSPTGLQEQQSGNTVSIEDIPFSDNFFVKDDLLQGNGLSWVLDSEMELIDETNIGRNSPDQDSASKQVQNPEILASEVEAELFKLFGGVNKKYKEKGRSLLFNLKDRNNPELRERVMSGEISPERLCSMTAEELASKELSEWRMAKAEELAQMVVLPDSEVDIRKLVRKTHKGEFQVEVEHDMDVVSAEVAVGTSFISQPQQQAKLKEKEQFPTPNGEKTNDRGKPREGEDASYTLTISSTTEGSDFMQGLMVDDELKDAAFLPPIVSLDEFMESLDTEPPFQSLPEDAGKATTPEKDDGSQVGSESKSPVATPEDPAGSSSGKARTDVMNVRADAADESSKEDHVKSDAASPPVVDDVIKGERVWEGSVQLNVSVMVSLVGIFKSGEKTPSKDWPTYIEIKGRVKLEAFEKFLQELPMSRSRAVMAVHFVCKEGSTESDKANVVEVAESYVGDERVGFAEPVSGVELYLCPPHSRICGLLSKVLPQDQMDALNLLANGLIGVVVWRKPQIISPHHKHSSKDASKKQQHSSSKNRNPKHQHSALPPPPPPIRSRPPPVNVGDDDDDDDVPPGFGPPVAGGSSRDEDDLPEFNFNSNAANRPPPGFPGGVRSFQSSNSPRGPVVDQMRELIHRYGQPGVGSSPLKNWTDNRVPVQPWKDDDDDDMPEWRPDDAQHHLARRQPTVVHGSNMIQQPVPQVMNPIVHHQTSALPPPPPPPGWQQQQQQQGGGWADQAVGPHGLYQQQQQPNGGQFYGGQQWSRDAPKSRGF
ncbi:unnamed protein product [Linum tenue]|uniref:TFIIS central domain-containing protein n=1 Tax=Linum tenue TaxID=586396 RepID=A0AAV0JXY7_9ROSI|nr:unnamed protein product [Linum tenue]